VTGGRKIEGQRQVKKESDGSDGRANWVKWNALGRLNIKKNSSRVRQGTGSCTIESTLKTGRGQITTSEIVTEL
jgi:hypothetical protein